LRSRRPARSPWLAAVSVAGILLGACNAKPTEGGPLWVSPDQSSACAPRAQYSSSVWGTPVRNDATAGLTISSVAPTASSNVTLGHAWLVDFSPEAGLLVQVLPLNDAQQGPWEKRVDAVGATIAAGHGPTLVLEVDVDPNATTASVTSLAIRYHDASGAEFIQTTNEGLEFKDVC